MSCTPTPTDLNSKPATMTNARIPLHRLAGSLAVILIATLTLSACAGNDSSAEKNGEEAPVAVERPTSASLPSGDAVAGEKLANTPQGANNQSCIQCHGAQGNHPNAEDRPKIGGQYHDYISHALQQYRVGERSNVTMMGQAKGLSDQQIADVAAYFAAQPSELTDLRHMK